MKQRQMPMLGEVPDPKLVPMDQVERCESLLDAINLCVQHSPIRKHYVIAEMLEMGPSQFHRCLRGTQHFPPSVIEHMEYVCQNRAITQYWCWSKGLPQPEMNEKEKKRQRLLAQLAELDDDQREAG